MTENREQRTENRREIGRKLRLFSKFAVYHGLKKRFIWRKRLVRSFYAGGVALVLLCGMVLQTYLQLKPPSYNLDEQTRALVGESRDDAKEYLGENNDRTAFEFTVPEEQATENKEHFGRNADIYSVNLAKDANQGITYTDTQTDIGITLMPKFKTLPGQKTNGDHIVYPAGEQKLVYTLKYNGLKEDIIIPRYLGDDLAYEFELVLPSGVEARLDEQGDIGIYSADLTLFGDISFGTDEDMELLDKAREKSKKTHLVATIPAPIIKDATGNEHRDKSQFILSSKTIRSVPAKSAQDVPSEVRAQLEAKAMRNVYALTIASRSLRDLPYPISIDPTITTGSASEWANGSFEGGIELDSSNGLIKRSGLSGGVVTWATDSSTLPAARWSISGAAYNGYVYAVGGNNGGNSQNVYVSKIGSTGALETPNLSGCAAAVWCQTTSFNGTGAAHDVVVANGHIYSIGGNHVSSTDDVQYAEINSDGSLSAWTSIGPMTSNREAQVAVAYNGWIYVAGGNVSGSIVNTVERAQINADGTLGSWTTSGTTNLPLERQNGASAVYNGYWYVMGGDSNTLGESSTVYYIKINSDGTLASSWSTTTAFGTARKNFQAITLDGYMYVMGGCLNGACSSITSQTEYAQINADGSLGTWRTTSNLGGNRQGFMVASYGAYMYVVGGCGTGACSSVTNTVYRTSPRLAGELHNATWSTGTNFTDARADISTAVYNGYLYVASGCNGSFCGSEFSTLHYALINSDGSLATDPDGAGLCSTTWCSITANATARINSSLLAYNGYLYLVGGCSDINPLSGQCVIANATVLYSAISATDGKTGIWTDSGQNFTNARLQHQAAIHGGYLYVFGGANAGDSTRYADTQFSQINSTTGDLVDDNPGCAGTAAWCPEDSLTNARRSFYGTAYNGYLYAVGGYNADVKSDIEYAQINSDGTIGAWQSGGNIDTARLNHNGFISNGYMYILGGCTASNCSTDTTAVEFAVINSDGTLGSWEPTQSFANSRQRFGTVVHNNVAYIIAGVAAVGGYRNSVEYQFINNGGSGSANTFTAGSSIVTGRHSHATLVLNGYIYVIGGCSGASATCNTVEGSVEKAAINADGSLGTFSSTGVASLNQSRWAHAATVYNGRLYISGGCTTTGCVSTTSLEYATPDSSGNISAWTTDTGGDFSTARSHHTMVSYSGFIYVMGGDASGTAQGTVQYAPINSGGDIGAWSSDGDSFSARSEHASFVYNGRVYVVGGCSVAQCFSNNHTTDTQYASLSTAGGVGAWATAATRFATGRHAHRVAASNGYVYITGGIIDGGNQAGDVQFAPILSSGNLGTWQKTTSFTTDRHSHGTVIENGKIYIVGGKNNTNPQTSAYYATLSSVVRVGSYSRLIDFHSGVKPTKLITRGTKLAGSVVRVSYKSVNNTSTTFSNSQTISDTGYGAGSEQSFNLGSNITLSRYLLLRYTIDDSNSTVFPDTGSETTVTDFDIYFDPNPNVRLRGGRSFTGGTDRGLDTAP